MTVIFPGNKSLLWSLMLEKQQMFPQGDAFEGLTNSPKSEDSSFAARKTMKSSSS